MGKVDDIGQSGAVDPGSEVEDEKGGSSLTDGRINEENDCMIRDGWRVSS